MLIYIFRLQFGRLKKIILKHIKKINMEKLNLVAELRSTTEKLSEVRAAKNIPAVVYGHGAENTIIKISSQS